MTQYHFVAASETFLTVEEPLDEVLRERVRNYGEQGKEIDFWLVKRPAFLNAPELKAIADQVQLQLNTEPDANYATLGKDLSNYGFEDYTRIKHVMSYIG